MPLRPLLPAPDSKPPTNRPPDDHRRTPRKRARTVVQACNYCRKVKAKCDGQRPTCGTCVAKTQECGYAGGPGQSRQEAMKSRLQMLEDLFKSLRVESSAEATRILDRIRSREDVSSTFERGIDGESSQAIDGESSQTIDGESSQAIDGESSQAIDGESSRVPGSDDDISASEVSPIEAPQSLRASSSSAVHPTTESLLSVSFSLSNIKLLDKGIEGFFSSNGKLFHVFSREEVARYQSHIFTKGDITLQKAVICYTSAVAAIGFQYLHEVESKVTEQSLYALARHYFEDVLQSYPFHAIKVCTLLALYNIMSKATVSLSYVEIGLSLARRHGLDQNHRDSNIPEGFWLDCRKAWRTLMFVSGWLASTLGYISGNDALAHKVQLSDFRFDKPEDLGEIVQIEMTKIAVMKSNILRMNLVFKDLSILSVETMMKDLDEWHNALPEEMDIDNIADQHLPADTRRSTCQVHLLYLGAIILLYRRVASHLLQAKTSDNIRDSLNSQLPTIRQVMKDGNLAANNSARILGLLLKEKWVYKRCWIMIFHSYTSLTILLFAVIRKQLYYRPSNEWEDDLDKAQHCLRTLEFCATDDNVARKFLERVEEPYKAILGHMRNHGIRPPINTSADTTMGATDEAQQESAQHPEFDSHEEYLFDIPKDSDADLGKSAVKLMEMLCRPFADVENMSEVENDIKLHFWDNPRRYEYSQFVERLDWDFERSEPFKWKIEQISRNLAADRVLPAIHPPSRWSGSSEPTGWLPAPPDTGTWSDGSI